MIFGNIHNPMVTQQIAMLPEPLGRALLFLKNHDMAAHEPGVFNIELGGVPVIMQVLDLNTSDRESLRPEIHKKIIDVQFLASGGPEGAGFYNNDGTGQIEEDLFSTPRDIGFFFNDPGAPESRIHMVPGTYAMYFPWDIHIPAIKIGESSAPIRKIVIKVPLDSCLPKESTKGEA